LGRPDGPLDGVCVQLEATIFQKEDKPGPVIERIAHGLCQTGTTGDPLELCLEPGMHRLDQWLAALLAGQPAIVGGLAANIGFNRIECRDALKCFLSQRGLRRDWTS
jgi:hypothetical protein